ncbi:Gamma-aminobutyraldehyde dehydrogenase [Streptomyces antimycoticus]
MHRRTSLTRTQHRSGDEDVDRAMRAAASAFAEWSRSTPRDRQSALLELADAVAGQAAEFSEAELRDTGSRDAAGEIRGIVDELHFFAGAARLLDGVAGGEYTPKHTSYTRREPVGVCAQLAPWNFPLLMAVLKAAPAIAAGNTVVLKPAHTTPSSALMLADLATRILPPGVLNVVCGGPATGRLMVEHPVPRRGLADRIGGGRCRRGHPRRRHAQTHPPRTGRQDPGPRVRRRRHLRRRADHRHRGRHQRGAGLHSRQPGPGGRRGARAAARGARAEASTAPRSALGTRQRVRAAEQPRATGACAGVHRRATAAARVVTGGHEVGDRGFFYAPTVIDGVRGTTTSHVRRSSAP